jgi:alpha-beta hydrolase superfamily lysophospholipase
LSTIDPPIWQPKASNWLKYQVWRDRAMKEAGSFKVPILIFSGKSDYMADHESIIDFVNTLPKGCDKKLKVYKNVGHVFFCLDGV